MMTDEKIKRINELAHKSKTPEGLTEEEKKEQAVAACSGSERSFPEIHTAGALRTGPVDPIFFSDWLSSF